MKAENEIRSQIETMKYWLQDTETKSQDKPLINAAIAALRWVLGETSDIFNDL